MSSWRMDADVRKTCIHEQKANTYIYIYIYIYERGTFMYYVATVLFFIY